MLQHYKWPKHCTLRKTRWKSLFMFIVFTLHQAWLSYSLSILCIWPKWPFKFSTRRSSKGTSPLNLIETNGTFESIIYFSKLEEHNLEVVCGAWNMAQRLSTTLRT
jgi:hypothetical protein